MNIKKKFVLILLIVAGCKSYSSSFGDYNTRNIDLKVLRNAKVDKICQSEWFNTSQNPDRYINSQILPQHHGKIDPLLIEYEITETLGAPVYKNYCVTIYE